VVVMSKYDLYRNTICKEDDNDYILLFKDEESAKNVYDEFNQKDQRIAELEKQLENAIVPKFKIGQEIWVIKRIKQEIANGKIIEQYSYFNGGTPENLRNVNRWRIRLKNNSEVTKKEYELFATREQAEEALKQLEGK